MLPITKSELEKLILKHLPQIIETRHIIHKHPELGHEEHNTCKLIRKILSDFKLEVLPPFLKTDTVAFLNRNKTGKNITLRADIDALKINEKNNLEYSSEVSNIMHACGHDGHTAILLGVAMVLSELKEKLNGSVRFIFQPAEEALCGSKDLLDAGAIDNPHPDIVFALHGWPGMKAGNMTTAAGYFTAACDTFKITVKGKGGHGTMPEKCNNPILIATKIIESLNQIPVNRFSFRESVLVSICKITGGTECNIIPDKVEIEGTVRYYKTDLGKKLKTNMEDIVKGICSTTDANYELNFANGYIPSYNNKQAVNFWGSTLKEFFDSNQLDLNDEPITASEDFSYFLQKAPGALFKLGLGENFPELHSCNFDFNDNAIKNGIIAFCLLALKFLQ